MIMQKHDAKLTKLPKSKVDFQKKNVLQDPLVVKQIKEQILKVSSDVTHYCVLGYN